MMASKLIKNYLPEIVALGLARTKPSMVTVNLTNRCNQECIYCEIGKSPQSSGKDALTFEDLTWIIDEMASVRIPKISLCGGEPFLFAGILDVVAYARKKNIRCSVTTNGMTAHRLGENELNVLKECQTEINVSIDSFNDEVQSLTRGTKAALPNALKSVQKLTAHGIPVTVLTVISKYNYRELSEFFSTAFEKGIQQVLFQPVIYYSNYPERPPVDSKSQLNAGIDNLDILMAELAKILQFEKKHKIKTNVYRIFPWINHYLKTAEEQDGKWFFYEVLHKFFCREIYAIIDISYDGGIQPCGLVPAFVSIKDNRDPGLINLWLTATEKIKKDLESGRYYPCCNGCCHHFSRNMLASVFKYPVKNRQALIRMLPLIISRVCSGIGKKLYFYGR
jgi:MoaA/NifB/PqqE/SkfB family radical SAM enzyme